MIFENAGKVLMHYDETASILLARAVEDYFGIEIPDIQNFDMDVINPEDFISEEDVEGVKDVVTEVVDQVLDDEEAKNFAHAVL